jgi:hypothetical protein
VTPGDRHDADAEAPGAEAPGGMEGIDTEPVTDSEDPGGMSGIPDPGPDKDHEED